MLYDDRGLIEVIIGEGKVKYFSDSGKLRLRGWKRGMAPESWHISLFPN
jgi:hypothetical protein